MYWFANQCKNVVFYCEQESPHRAHNRERSLSDLPFKRATLTAALKTEPKRAKVDASSQRRLLQ